MYRRRGISLIVGLLILAFFTQAAIAAGDGTGEESPDQVAVNATPTITVAPEVTVEPTTTGVMPEPTATPEVTVTPTVEPTMEATPEPTVTPEVTVTPTVEATTEATPEPTPAITPEVTVNATVEPTTEATPEPTATPEVTVTPTVEPTAEATPEATPAITPEVTVNATVEPTTEATPEPTPAITPEVTVNATLEPAVTTPTPVITPAENITVQETIVLDPRLAPIDPAFSQYLGSMRPGRTSADMQGHTLGYIPPPVNLSHLKGRKVAWAAVDAEAEIRGTDLATLETETSGYPALYDLRIAGKVTPVRDQGECGACWAFATYGSLESTLLPGAALDFSENNMLNIHGYDRGRCDGGSDRWAMAYLARWDGPVNEKADPFIIDALFSPSDLRTRRHAQEMFIIPPRNDFTDNNNLKAAIMNYGGVYSAMEYDGGALNLTHAAYYAEYPAYWANHAITLVGWDDTFSRDNFLTVPVDYEGNTLMWIDDTTPYVSVPPGDGAFIAKNSWGTGFGENGYFYISYYDPMIGFTENTVFTAEPLKNLKQVYQYDDLGWVYNLRPAPVDSDTAWFGNVFRAQERASVAAVSFYTTAENSEYTVSVYTDPTNGPIKPAGPVSTRIGSFELAGYHTVDLDPTVLVNLGQKFSVVVKIKTPGNYYPVAIELGDPYFLTSNAVAHPGESYISSDGSAWEDTAELIPTLPNINVCLKAFTVPAIPPPDARFTATPKKGHAPVKVTFRDRSIRKPASWFWEFGDGTTSTERNPVHTYMKAGTFTVNLTVKNSGGEDFTTKESYITVGEGKRKARPYYDFKKRDDDDDDDD